MRDSGWIWPICGPKCHKNPGYCAVGWCHEIGCHWCRFLNFSDRFLNVRHYSCNGHDFQERPADLAAFPSRRNLVTQPLCRPMGGNRSDKNALVGKISETGIETARCVQHMAVWFAGMLIALPAGFAAIAGTGVRLIDELPSRGSLLSIPISRNRILGRGPVTILLNAHTERGKHHNPAAMLQ